jgi:DedD protein
VLVLIGVIGFPLLFDKQPRPIAVDTPIDIPDKNKVSPLALPAPPASSIAPLAPVAAPATAPVALAASAPQSVVITESAEPAKVVKPETSVVSPPVAAKATEADKVQALLDGKAAQEPAAVGRFVVQVGAFADPVRAREVRLKLERAGLKTYTHVAETKDGPRTRVRVGPFSSKAEAEKTAEKIKKLNLPAGLLTL